MMKQGKHSRKISPTLRKKRWGFVVSYLVGLEVTAQYSTLSNPGWARLTLAFVVTFLGIQSLWALGVEWIEKGSN
jgi:hypothetical protein